MVSQTLASERPAGRVKDPEATRERLLQCAFDEMHEKGYAGASLDQILADSGVTKGALYHHFGSKADLAVAVIDEIIRPLLLGQWVDPIRGSDDPASALIDLAEGNFANADERFVECGCPLNNLSQELSNADERFRRHLNAVFDAWRGGLEEAFSHGQELGTIRQDIAPAAIASFIVAGIEGLASTLKTSRDVEMTMSAGSVLLQFVAGLRTTVDQPAA